ncbi:hypothetical protein BRC89_12705 [Halobacteriales archaeon QS_4_70_19]|nr:MAG: hypothetical protein BRC89_12705 [Halobacteriales archaeon QS_4_70_19]
MDDVHEGKAALELFEDRLIARVSARTRQLSQGLSPSERIVAGADEVDADRIVVALRRHTRTERVIFGSVSHALLQRVTRPITLVPLEEYQASAP